MRFAELEDGWGGVVVDAGMLFGGERVRWWPAWRLRYLLNEHHICEICWRVRIDNGDSREDKTGDKRTARKKRLRSDSRAGVLIQEADGIASYAL